MGVIKHEKKILPALGKSERETKGRNGVTERQYLGWEIMSFDFSEGISQ